MAYYIRKSIRVGPLRFNLSKSGIGVSTGIRGLRVGTGPRGNYIHMGRGGLYYRKTLPSHRTPSDRHAEPHHVASSYAPPATHGPMEAIASGCVTEMVDSSSAALLAELERKRKRIRTWPIVLGLSIATLVVLVGLGASLWVTIPLAVVMAVGGFLAYEFDILKKSVVMMYDLDSESSTVFRGLYDAITSLARCGATWHVNARGDVYDPKYHAGAGHLVRRNRIHVSEHDPPFVRTNLAICRLPLGNRSLYFFPDRILVYASNGVGALSYGDLCVDQDSTRFIEDGHVPRDAEVVDRTWQYVNKSGGPDRRFKGNRELPVCLYEDIRLHSPTGLKELLQVSRKGVAAKLATSVKVMASSIATASLVDQQRPSQSAAITEYDAEKKPMQERPVSPSHVPTNDEVHETLFDVLCCVMVADGRASRSEKARIIELMRKVRASWTPPTIDNRIAMFIERVKTTGYSRVVSETVSRASCFKQIGREDVLLKCIDSIAAADGKLEPNEQALCERFREAVS